MIKEEYIGPTHQIHALIDQARDAATQPGADLNSIFYRYKEQIEDLNRLLTYPSVSPLSGLENALLPFGYQPPKRGSGLVGADFGPC